MIVFPNADKDNRTSKRVLLCAKPNSGKTVTLLNMIVQQHLNGDPFEKIYLYHLDNSTTEYDMVSHEKCIDIPCIEEFDRDIKNLLIIEDINIKHLKRKELDAIIKLFKYTSHLNTSIYITTQNPFSICPDIRRLCDEIILWNYNNDSNVLRTIEAQMGLQKNKLSDMFKYICPGQYDSIRITRDGKMFKNIVEEI